MGVEPFLLSSSLLGVLAQRLVRKLCPHCKRPSGDGPLAPGGLRPLRPHRLQGPHRRLRADGRSTTSVQRLIHERAPEHRTVRRGAERAGLRSMREDGERLDHRRA
ncbi:MAG: hypothetical protein MZW92_65225 [Comamonadaceae bacterium]|nr:hypothetical protein [Comamonadaceae bacterium]